MTTSSNRAKRARSLRLIANDARNPPERTRSFIRVMGEVVCTLSTRVGPWALCVLDEGWRFDEPAPSHVTTIAELHEWAAERLCALADEQEMEVMMTIQETLEQLRLHWPQWGWHMDDGKIAARVQLGETRVTLAVEAGPGAWRATVGGAGVEGVGVAACAVDAVLGASRVLRKALREVR